jgi:hypothetical protein
MGSAGVSGIELGETACFWRVWKVEKKEDWRRFRFVAGKVFEIWIKFPIAAEPRGDGSWLLELPGSRDVLARTHPGEGIKSDYLFVVPCTE